MIRAITRYATVAALALALTAGPAIAGDDGTVQFQLTIRGTPDAGDTFGLALTSSTGIILSGGIFCGPWDGTSGPPRDPCEAGDFTADFAVPVGSELTYTFWRSESFDGDGTGDETLLEATITVQPGTQRLTLVYDYALVPTLPDTALPSAP